MGITGEITDKQPDTNIILINTLSLEILINISKISSNHIKQPNLAILYIYPGFISMHKDFRTSDSLSATDKLSEVKKIARGSRAIWKSL